MKMNIGESAIETLQIEGGLKQNLDKLNTEFATVLKENKKKLVILKNDQTRKLAGEKQKLDESAQEFD
jgi:hypothetical protein